MGQFSWFTQDTNHRIVNGENYKVVMTDDKGNKYYFFITKKPIQRY